MRYSILCLLCLALGSVSESAERPLVMLRFCAGHTETEAQWQRTHAAFAANRGCCDEVWFSSGESFPNLDWHRAQAKRIAVAAKDLEKLGIRASLQLENTIGHGDSFITDEEKRQYDKPWGGWTGSTGVACRYCNCPRQPGFRQRIADVAAIYADVHFATIWIDDDLRPINHRPASDGSRLGCWCAQCIADFNAKTQGTWTRESLCAAMKDNRKLEEDWDAFSTESLAEIARIITAVVRNRSPGTRLGLQYSYKADRDAFVRTVMKTMARASGKPIGARPGGGYYYDLDPHQLLVKSALSAHNRMRLDLDDVVDNWCPEIESYPRAYGSRCERSMALEAFAALGYGLDTVSMLVLDWRSETDELYSRTVLAPLVRTRRFLADYMKASGDAVPAGFRCSGEISPSGDWYRLALGGIPLLAGKGRAWLAVGEADRFDVCRTPSAKVQAVRDALDAKAGGTAAALQSPFVGLVLPRVNADGTLKTLGLIATRIEPQGPVRVKVAIGKDAGVVLRWRSLDGVSASLPIERTDAGTFVTIPKVEAWSAGFIAVDCDHD